MRVSFFLALALAVAGPFSALAAQYPATVDGRVVDASSGRPVAHARVRAAAAPSNVVLTDALGAFRLRLDASGPARLEVTAPGYASAAPEVEVAHGRTSRLRVTLRPLPIPLAGLEVAVDRRGGAAHAGFVVVPDEADRLGSSLGALVARAPGVTVHGRGPGAGETVSIRGSAAHEVLVLVDGVPLNDPLTGAADLSTVAAASVARVEVLSGARSARFGGRAQAGVVLVETRAAPPGPSARLAVGDLGAGLAALEYGSVGTPGRDPTGGSPRAPVRGTGAVWSVGGGHEAAEGGFAYDRPEAVGGGRRDRLNADHRRTWAAARLGSAALAGGLDLRLRAEAGARGLPGRSYAPSPRARQSDARAQAAAAWVGRTGRAPEAPILELEVDAAWQRSRVRDPAPPAGLPWHDTVAAAGWGLRATLSKLPATAGFSPSGGFDVRGQSVDASSLAGAASQRVDAGAWAAAARAFAGRLPLEVRATGRLDRTPRGARLLPSHEIALSARPSPDVTLRLAHRSAWSPPSLADQYFESGVGVEPNPDLEAERVPSEWELGASAAGDLGRVRLDATVALWGGDVEGMIVWTPDFRFVWSPRNVDVTRRGGELAAGATLDLGSGTLRLAADWAVARVRYDRPSPGDVQVVYRPEHTARVALAWSGPGLDAEVGSRFTGRRYPVPARVNALEAFWATEASVSGGVDISGWRVRPTLAVDRLLDTRETMIFGFPEPGRTWRLGLTLTPER